MIKFKTISLIILIIGFVFNTSSFATLAPSGQRSHMTVKKNKQKSGHRFKPRHGAKAHHHLKRAHHKKHRGQTKYSFLRKR